MINIERHSSNVFGLLDFEVLQPGMFLEKFPASCRLVNSSLSSLAAKQVVRVVVLTLFLSAPPAVFLRAVGGGFRDWLRKLSYGG